MPAKRIISLIIVGIALCAFFGACADPRALVGKSSGCQREIRGAVGVNRPETSKLNCKDINGITFSLPSEPDVYLVMGESPKLLWKCWFYGTDAEKVLLRCEHHARHFSIVKTAD